MRFFTKPTIRLERVDLGVRAVEIPLAEMTGGQDGPTLLVTGGVDGDEYAGIEAAYAIIAKYSRTAFSGRLVVVPIVNVPGFFAEMSQNPMDGRFPKYAGLGHDGGMPSQRLMHWLATYARSSAAWMDLHAGAITERLRPFAWVWDSGNAEVDRRFDAFAERLGADLLVRERAWTGKTVELARSGCAYVVSEAGERGERAPGDVAHHVRRVEAMMRALGMIPDEPIPAERPEVLRRVEYVFSTGEGIWRPESVGERVERGTKLGVSCGLDARREKTVVAPAAGVVLWKKDTMAMRDKDLLLVSASP